MYVVMSCSPCTEKVKIQSTGILFAVMNFSSEIMFRQHLKSQKAAHLSVPTDKIVDLVLATPDVKSLWESIIADLDLQVPSECSKLALENFIKLYVQVWSFSHGFEKITLRKELKKADN